MSVSVAVRLGWAAWATSLVLVSAASLASVVYLSPRGVEPYPFWREVTVNTLIYATVGLFIVTRRPDHMIGWLLTVAGLLGATQFLTGQCAMAGLATGHQAAADGALFAWLSNQAQVSAAAGFIFLLLLFPSGRATSTLGRALLWATTAGITLGLLSAALTPGPLANFPNATNPFGVPSIPRPVLALGNALAGVLVANGILAGVISLFVRFRRARGLERQQLKWFAYAGALGFGVLVGAGLLLPDLMRGALGSLMWAVAPSSLAVAAAIAIVRYRLWDIDVIIRRTLIYGALTAALALVYFGGVVVLQALLQPLTGGGGDLAIIISTLAIAALFNPLRRCIQDAVDRRFYRRKYDAEQVLAAFTATLREEVDFDRLNAALLAVVEDTMQPAHVSLWIRGPGNWRRAGNDRDGDQRG